MSIADFYTKEFTIRRMAWDTDESDNDFSEQTDIGTFSGHIQQAAMQLAQHLGLAFTKTFTIWCPLGTDVQEGDTLLQGDYLYHVKAKQTFENSDNKHIELHCERELDEEETS